VGARMRSARPRLLRPRGKTDGLQSRGEHRTVEAQGNAGDAPLAGGSRGHDNPPAPRGMRSAAFGRFGVLGAFVLTFAIFSILRTSVFLQGDNLKAVLQNSAPLAILAFGLTVALSMGDFDLSIAAMADLAGAIAVVLMADHGVGWGLAVITALVVGGGGGLINGGLVAYLGASSFVITLGMGMVFTGFEYAVTHQKTIFQGIPTGYTKLTSSQVLGFNAQVFVALAVMLAGYVLMERSEVGRRMRAVGGNREAAYLSGINVRWIRTSGFVIVGVASALAGVLITSQSGSSAPALATGLLLPAFAAAFLGSAAFHPGEFNMFGTLLGALFLGVLQNGLTLMGASTAAINIAEGGILVFAVLLTRVGRRDS
jgi:ribose transport system permease protein